jgi:hypothetical protein
LEGILRSDAVNRYTLTKREQMAADAAKLHNQFKSRIQWISEQMHPGENTCFVCNSHGNAAGPYKTGIIF